MTTNEAARAVQKRLFDAYRIHTVWRGGVRNGPVIRVTPGFFSTPDNVDALARALRAEHSMLL
jgi:selenocysteine lyase/cysteine desulfurase